MPVLLGCRFCWCNYNSCNLLSSHLKFQVSHALVHMHEIGLIHRDIAARNVLLNKINVDGREVFNCKVSIQISKKLPFILMYVHYSLNRA